MREKQIEIIRDLLTEFDEMGFIPSVMVPDTEAYAIKWREQITKAFEEYRNQSEGEWETIPDTLSGFISYRHICSECKTFYKDIRPHGHNYCHNCGAKMKGE